MKENLQKIKDACIKANPEIMELKFGCEVLMQYSAETQIINTPKNEGKWFGITNYETAFNPEEVKEILGRPIRLADVLLAIHAKAPENKTRITLESDGQFIQRLDNGSFTEPWARSNWNLKDDNLEHQSEECINFIAELL